MTKCSVVASTTNTDNCYSDLFDVLFFFRFSANCCVFDEGNPFVSWFSSKNYESGKLLWSLQSTKKKNSSRSLREPREQFMLSRMTFMPHPIKGFRYFYLPNTQCIQLLSASRICSLCLAVENTNYLKREINTINVMFNMLIIQTDRIRPFRFEPLIEFILCPHTLSFSSSLYFTFCSIFIDFLASYMSIVATCKYLCLFVCCIFLTLYVAKLTTGYQHKLHFNFDQWLFAFCLSNLL